MSSLRRIALFAPLGVLVLAFGAPAGGAPARPLATISVRPIADALVTSAQPRRNFGKSRILQVDRRPAIRSYLRFRITSLSGKVRNATLRLYVSEARGRGIRVAKVHGSWSERRVIFARAPQLRATVGRGRAKVGWIDIDVTRAVRGPGTVNVSLASAAPTGSIRFASRESKHQPQLIVTTGKDPVIAAAGQIACDPTSPDYNGGNGDAIDCRDKDTAALLTSDLAAVLPLGDAQYFCGGLSAYQQAYDRAWGKFKAITHPVPGNHDYVSSDGTGCDPTGKGGGYFGYFGAAAGTFGKSYYSYDVGTWHLIALDSQCTPVGGCGPGSPEETWLRDDLAAHPNTCALAYWHYPIFSSGFEGGKPDATTFWKDLDAAGVDVVLNAHEHDYERFAPQDIDGKAAANGIREFVVGTGGRMRHPFGTVRANSQVRDSSSWGVLKLTLHPSSYGWRFEPAAGGTLHDAGSASCH
jgi:hypothetical protein